jgi:hypothetical protein
VENLGKKEANSRCFEHFGHLTEAERLPCFKTGTPAAAVTIEAMLEMFTVPSKSPPVPTMSTASEPVSSFKALLNMASTNPDSSSTLSPL